MRRPTIVALGIAVIAAVVGVVTFAIPSTTPGTGSVRGLLVDVQSRDILAVQSVTLRDPDGGLILFVVSPEAMDDADNPISASHLRQHLVAGIPVLIHYRRGDGRSADGSPVAIRILDAETTEAP